MSAGKPHPATVALMQRGASAGKTGTSGVMMAAEGGVQRRRKTSAGRLCAGPRGIAGGAVAALMRTIAGEAGGTMTAGLEEKIAGNEDEGIGRGGLRILLKMLFAPACVPGTTVVQNL